MKQFNYNQYTYRDMTKPQKRENMMQCQVAWLGTQSGGFGSFREEFRVISLTGLIKLKAEVKKLGLTQEQAPLLFEVINEKSASGRDAIIKGVTQ